MLILNSQDNMEVKKESQEVPCVNAPVLPAYNYFALNIPIPLDTTIKMK